MLKFWSYRQGSWSHLCRLKYPTFLIVIIYAFLTGVVGNLCRNDIKSDDFRSASQRSSIPKGGKLAGNFSKDETAEDIISCVLSCCRKNSCDSIFFHNSVCYRIHCNRSYLGSCDPVLTDDPKFNTTVLVGVRDVEYETKSVSTSTPERQLTVCTYGLFEQCQAHEECKLRDGSKSRQGLCKCKPGFERDSSFSCVAVTSEVVTTAVTTSIEATTLPAKVVKLTVSAGENKNIQLPEKTVTLSAYVLPKQNKGEDPYHYEWSLVSHPDGAETGTMEGKNTNTLKLSNLIAGLYSFKIQVTGQNKYGEASVNVTVEAPIRKNKRPVAIIKPTNQKIKLPNSAILDGSDSTDDDKIVSYHWEEVSGPLQDQQIKGDEPMLRLKNLAPGKYTFKLTVTDSDGATDSASANVTFIQEEDYPPKANAGSDVIIHLPQKSLTLYGNASTDDKGIASYEWITKADGKLTADMTGVRTPFLHLNNLEEGDYTFTLKVTDTSGKMAVADVHVFVKPETNQPPVAKTGNKITVALPTNNLVLDGSNSTDDQKVVKYTWTQTGGPSTLLLQNSDRAVATATGKIVVGDYTFHMIVADAEDRTSSSDLKITVIENQNKAPVANAGGSKVVHLPLTVVTLDGSLSSDDVGIVKYTWDRDIKSLAAGDIINGSDHQAVLQLVNLVAGRYIFKLTVVDGEGLSSSDTASVIVKEDPQVLNVLELMLDADIKQFTAENEQNLISQLQLLLHKSSSDGDTVVKILHLRQDESTGYLHINLVVKSRMKEEEQMRKGTEVLKILKRKLVSESSVLDYKVIRLDTVVCQNNCSGHGNCDSKTKKCVCEAFWMQNFFTAYFFQKESNCDWSILYVVIVCFVSILAVSGGIWGVICCLRSKRCKFKTRKRHRYSLLREVDDDVDAHKLELMPKGKIQNSSVMISESDFSSEEETLFINHKKPNGHIQKPLNGLSKQHFKTKLKA